MSAQAKYLAKRGWVQVERKKRGCYIQVWWVHPEKAPKAAVPQGWAVSCERIIREAKKNHE